MNHLLIGLGGTGGRMIRAFRKLHFQAFRDDEPADLGVDYLFVDSDPKSFVPGDPSWTFMGRSLALPPRNQLPIAQANLHAVVDNLNSYPALKPWLGDRAAWGEILASLNLDAAGGQKRRLGRFLMAMSIERFNNAVRTLVRELQERKGSSDMTFHVMCGLAGGTGSGAVIDVVAQLRSLFPDVSKRILVYAYLPGLNPPANWNTGNYHANAYAALKELNAMSASAWAPFDVASTQGEVSRRFSFNGCYVFTDENERGFSAGVDKLLPDIVGDFLFHKIVVAREVAWSDLGRFENAENGDSTPESLAGTGQPLRSVRFLGFGIRRIEFPEERIHESLAYEYQVQALEQLRFNNWQDGFGFIDQPRPDASAQYVASAQARENWLLTDEHLRLARPVVQTESSARWRPHGDTWAEMGTHYVRLTQQVDKAKWLSELYKLFALGWTEQYRGQGVKPFFELALRDVKGQAGEIRRHVEAGLMADWRQGARSLTECSQVVSALLHDLRTRQAQTAVQAQKREEQGAILHEQFKALEREWSDFRLLAAVTSSRERDLEKAGVLLRDFYHVQTEAEANRFAHKLLAEALLQLEDLLTDIDRSNAQLAQAVERSRKAIASRASARASDGGAYIDTIEEPALTEQARRTLLLNAEEQARQTSAVRQDILALLGQYPTFEAFADRQDDIRDVLLRHSETNVRIAHDKLITSAREKVLGVSIMDKLAERHGSDPAQIDLMAREAVNKAVNFLSLNPTEVNKHFPGRSASPRATTSLAVLMPEPEAHKAFVQRLRQGFSQAYSKGPVSFVKTDDRSNEISLISLVNLFPLRFVTLVEALKAKYEQRFVQLGAARAALELHTEGDGEQLPDLFIASAGEVRAQARPVLLLAQAVGLLETRPHPQTGQPVLVRPRVDADGFALEPEMLGASLISAADELDEARMQQLRLDTLAALDARGPGRPEVQTAIRDAMQATLKELAPHFSTARAAAQQQDWNDAARVVMQHLRGDKPL